MSHAENVNKAVQEVILPRAKDLRGHMGAIPLTTREIANRLKAASDTLTHHVFPHIDSAVDKYTTGAETYAGAQARHKGLATLIQTHLGASASEQKDTIGSGMQGTHQAIKNVEMTYLISANAMTRLGPLLMQCSEILIEEYTRLHDAADKIGNNGAIDQVVTALEAYNSTDEASS
jgi:hypothetical protein